MKTSIITTAAALFSLSIHTVQCVAIPVDTTAERGFNLRVIYSGNDNSHYLQPSGPNDEFMLGVVSPLTSTASTFYFDTSRNGLSVRGHHSRSNKNFHLGAAFEMKSYVDLQSRQVPLYFAAENNYDTVVKNTFGFQGANLTLGDADDWWVCDKTEDLSGGNVDVAVHLGRAWIGPPREGCQKVWIIRE